MVTEIMETGTMETEIMATGMNDRTLEKGQAMTSPTNRIKSDMLRLSSLSDGERFSRASGYPFISRLSAPFKMNHTLRG